MKNTQRATLYASLFLLTTVTFGNSSAVLPRKELQKLKQVDALRSSIEKNESIRYYYCATLLIGFCAALVCPLKPLSVVAMVAGSYGVGRYSERLGNLENNLAEKLAEKKERVRLETLDFHLAEKLAEKKEN